MAPERANTKNENPINILFNAHIRLKMIANRYLKLCFGLY